VASSRLTSFHDLDVYRQTYDASLNIMKHLLPSLPTEERYDLKDQLRRSCKAIPRLIAEGYAKRHQLHGFQKYLVDAAGECNEMIVSLSHCRDVYAPPLNHALCEQLIDRYDKAARQLYNSAKAWGPIANVRRWTPDVTPSRCRQTLDARRDTPCIA